MQPHALRNIQLRITVSSFVLIVAGVSIISSVWGDENAAAISIEITGTPNRPFLLGIRAPSTVKDADAFILLGNVPDKAKLNIGIDVGKGSWLVPAYAQERLTLTVPHAGHVRMTAQLLDAQFAPASTEEPIRIAVIEPGNAAHLGN